MQKRILSEYNMTGRFVDFGQARSNREQKQQKGGERERESADSGYILNVEFFFWGGNFKRIRLYAC